MIYFDTSILAPLILREATSTRVSALFARLRGQDRVASHWTRVEFSSLLARECRMGGLDAKSASRADDKFEAMLAASFDVVLPGGRDFDRAKKFLADFTTGLRAADALHLAIAANRNAARFYTLDTRLLKAGRQLGMKIASLSE